MENQTSQPHQIKSPDIDPVLEKKVTEVVENIRRLKARAHRGFYTIAVFMIVSIGAVRDFDFLPSFPPHIRAILGRPPSSNMISAALMLYSFSAIILILSRMMSGAGSYSGIAHVGYLSGFYFFYHFSGALNENFLAVFAAGMTVLGLESYHIWTYSMEEIKKEEEILEELGNDYRKKRWING
jgi:hypothetical protein